MSTLVSFYKGTERVGAPVLLEHLPGVGEIVVLARGSYKSAFTAKVMQVVHDISHVSKGGQRSADIYVEEFSPELLLRLPQDQEYAKELLAQAKGLCEFIANPERLHVTVDNKFHSGDEILRSIDAFLTGDECNSNG